MATRQRSSKARRAQSRPLRSPGDRQKPQSQKTRPSNYEYGVPVPASLREAIEAERDNLSKAESLLACMVVSMEHQNDPLDGPYYPAVAQLARELVERTINGLDPFTLRQRLLRNKIEEVFSVAFVDQTYPFVPSECDAGSHRLAA
jgi:hypothetical protein